MNRSLVGNWLQNKQKKELNDKARNTPNNSVNMSIFKTIDPQNINVRNSQTRGSTKQDY